MNYSIEQIITLADCNALLDAATLNKRRLQGKKVHEEDQYTLLNSSAGIDVALASIAAIITAYQSVYDAMQEGPAKRNYLLKIQQQQVKQTQLQTRRERYGVQALLEKEFAMTCLDEQIVESDAYIQALTDRKGKL